MDKELLILLYCKYQVGDWLGLPKHLGLERRKERDRWDLEVNNDAVAWREDLNTSNLVKCLQ